MNAANATVATMRERLIAVEACSEAFVFWDCLVQPGAA
jgi:hypothetical protein